MLTGVTSEKLAPTVTPSVFQLTSCDQLWPAEGKRKGRDCHQDGRLGSLCTKSDTTQRSNALAVSQIETRIVFRSGITLPCISLYRFIWLILLFIEINICENMYIVYPWTCVCTQCTHVITHVWLRFVFANVDAWPTVWIETLQWLCQIYTRHPTVLQLDLWNLFGGWVACCAFHGAANVITV